MVIRTVDAIERSEVVLLVLDAQTGFKSRISMSLNIVMNTIVLQLLLLINGMRLKRILRL